MEKTRTLWLAGVDFGGTAAKVGILDQGGRLKGKRRLEINPQASYEEIFAAVAAEIRRLAQEAGVDLAAVGVGAPGFIDCREGRVLQGSENLPAFKQRSLVAYLADEFGLPVFADNDANCAAAGELKFGMGRGYRHFVMLTLGAGVGGALVVDGRIHRGSRGLAGELGHMCLDAEGPPCNCGSRGCLEQYASAPAITAAYLRERAAAVDPAPQGKPITPLSVFRLAASGEPCAREVVERTASRIAQALGTLVNLMDTQACLIGGGVSIAGELLLEPVRRHLPRFAWPLPLTGVQLHAAALSNDAGILGAAAQAWERLEQ